jgi:preprotein translocase subunit SecG
MQGLFKEEIVNQALIITQVVVGVLMTLAILLQAKGASLGEAFGGSGVFYGSRRGAEKTLFVITAVLSVIFVAISYIMLFV